MASNLIRNFSQHNSRRSLGPSIRLRTEPRAGIEGLGTTPSGGSSTKTGARVEVSKDEPFDSSRYGGARSGRDPERQSKDERFMRLALRLASRAHGETSPNPVVGAVIVRGGRIVGRGYHRGAGLPHAEIEAMRQAGQRARGSTLYVTLEPCNHTGRTPPCCDAILSAGIKRVVIAARDPNPITQGRGMARLRRAGLEVTAGVLGDEATRLNEPFQHYITRRLPWVIAKIATSLDGKIATTGGESRWITSAASRTQGQRLRQQVDAILVGVNTVLKDDPLLTVRGRRSPRNRPIKIIVDSRLRTPPSARVVSSASPAPTLLATVDPPASTRRVFEARGVEVLRFPPQNGRVPLRRLLQELARRQMATVLIEGGGEVLASALSARLVNRLVWFIAPIILGGRRAPSAVGGGGIQRLARAIRLADVTVTRVGSDLCLEGRVVYPKGARGERRRVGTTRRRVPDRPRIPRPALQLQSRGGHVLRVVP